MKTLQADPEKDVRVTVPKAARCIGSTVNTIHRWGREGKFGYRQTGPQAYFVRLSEVLDFYHRRYPRAEINKELFEALTQSSA